MNIPVLKKHVIFHFFVLQIIGLKPTEQPSIEIKLMGFQYQKNGNPAYNIEGTDLFCFLHILKSYIILPIKQLK